MKTSIFIFLGFLFIQNTFAQFTAIPDSNFEQALIDLGLDDVIDGQVATANIIDVEELELSNLGINNLTGIEAFNSLIDLFIDSNGISNIDLSQNVALQLLIIDNNPLSTIDISNNINLFGFSASQTSLTFLDTSSNIDLEILDIEDCAISSLDLSNNINLGVLSASGNQLTEIDLTSNINLEEVSLYFNQLQTINLENQSNLLDLYIDFNLLTEIDLSNNALIEELDCSFNPFLSFINLKNGNNEVLDVFSAENIATNACIQVDDATAATAGVDFPYNQWEVDASASFSENCSLSLDSFEITEIKLYPNPTTDKLNLLSNEITAYKIYDTNGRLLLNISSFNSNQIDVSFLNPGVYILEVKNENNRLKMTRFIKY